MHYNICIVRPTAYIHSDAFLELAEVLMHSLIDLGNSAVINENLIDTEGGRNIIIGCHLLDPAMDSVIPKDTIILNTEQIYADNPSWHEPIYFWVKKFETWDYSERNIIKLNTLCSQTPKLLRIGHHSALERIAPDQKKDIDVLFYGSTNDRRIKILNELSRNNIVTKAVFGVYGKERDDLIARSKIVLNLHYFESKIFEIVRTFYLMINKKVIVSEVSPETHIPAEYLSGIVPAKYEDLVKTCKELLEDQSRAHAQEIAAYNCIKKLPQSSFTKLLLF